MDVANREEADKCKRISNTALDAGDVGKAIRFLEKAKRMNPEDPSIDTLLERARSGDFGGGTPAGGCSSGPSGFSQPAEEEKPAPRPRPSPAAASASSSAAGGGATRVNKQGGTYTQDQMRMVQKILRTKDYYDLLELPREASEDMVKKVYKKMALKLHPDKNKAPGAEEAFKKVSKAVQCLTDPEKKQIYDQYGDEDKIPQQHRHHYQQDFMTPDDLFNAFFGGGAFHQHHHHSHHGDGEHHGQARPQLLQLLPVLILVLLTLASNFAPRDSSSRFSFSPNGQYVNERVSNTLNVNYYVSHDFDEHYPENSRGLNEFERQVEIYHVRQLHSDCDYQEKIMYKKVMHAKRRQNEDEIAEARKHPRPACKEIERVKRRYAHIYRQAIYMGY